MKLKNNFIYQGGSLLYIFFSSESNMIVSSIICFIRPSKFDKLAYLLLVSSLFRVLLENVQPNFENSKCLEAVSQLTVRVV